MRSINTRVKLLLSTAVFVLVFWQLRKFFSVQYNSSNSKESVDKLEKPQKVLVSVYYEALCPDSRSFVITQLVPTNNILEDYVSVQLIPYGKAETIVTNDDYIFKCQHGETECEANIIHACAIEKIKDPKKSLEVVACMIKNNIHPMSIFKHCTKELDEQEEILSCSQSIEGRKLLAKHGEATKALRPRVGFIPTITLDHKSDNQVQILKNLMRQVCLKLKKPPQRCDDA